MISSLITRAEEYFTIHRQNVNSTKVYIRALTVFLILKCVTLWSVAESLLPSINAGTPQAIIARVLFLPSTVANQYPHMFFAGVIVILIATLFFQPGYASNTFLFLIALNLFRLKFPVTNGSDYVLLLFSLYSIPLTFRNFQNENLQVVAVSGFNLFRVVAQWQISLIYLISAWDKICSEVWRSGKAFQYIANMETIVDPLFGWVGGPGTSSILSWLTILFEFSFVILIWQKRTRVFILCVGIFFHLAIWIMLSLPDFGLIIILTYLLFVRDGELNFLRKPPKRLLL